MPRNEFMNHEAQIPEDATSDELVALVKSGEVSINKAREFLGLPTDRPGKGEDEDLNLEESPVEENPEPEVGSPSLADLRKGPGLTTTEAHRKTRPVLPPED